MLRYAGYYCTIFEKMNVKILKNKNLILLISILIFLAAGSYMIFFKEENVMPLTKSWEIAIPNQKTPAGLVDLSAKNCGTCHVNHYNEWKQSTHANAWTDMQFQAELKKESSPFMCINCHIPLQNQQEYIVTGLVGGDIYKPVKVKNEAFDRTLQQEGITCASCHVRDGHIVGPTGTSLAPHPVKKAPAMLDEKLCISCHNATAVITPTLACTFETGDEWKRGPFYGKKNCISCHMPEVEREIVMGYPKRKSHYHTFAGSGIPKHDTLTAPMLNGYGFYPEKVALNTTLDKPIKYTLRIKNEFAGHRVPSGDPERFVLVNYQLLNNKNEVVAKKQYRIGEEWQWYPVAKKISDNNMDPGEERLYEFNSKVTEKGTYKLKVEVTKHRMTDETAAYNKLDKTYPRFISVYEKSYDFVVK